MLKDKSAQGIDCRFISRLQGTPPKEVVYLRQDDVVKLIRAFNTDNDASTDFATLANSLERIER